MNEGIDRYARTGYESVRKEKWLELDKAELLFIQFYFLTGCPDKRPPSTAFRTVPVFPPGVSVFQNRFSIAVFVVVLQCLFFGVDFSGHRSELLI